MAEQNTATKMSAGEFRAAQRQSAAGLRSANNTQNYVPIPEQPSAGLNLSEPRVQRPPLNERAANRNAERIRAASGSRLNLDNTRSSEGADTPNSNQRNYGARSPRSTKGRLNALKQVARQSLSNPSIENGLAAAQGAGEVATKNAYRSFMYASAAAFFPGYFIAWCMSMLQGIMTVFGDFFISESTQPRLPGSPPVSLKNFPRLGMRNLQQLGDSLFFALNFIVLIAVMAAMVTTAAMLYSFMKYFNDLGIDITDLVPGTTFFEILRTVFEL
jgi:hypothetical protein